MSQKYQYLAGLQESTGEIVYSRARHDFNKTTDGNGWIDGGTDYCRHSGLKLIVIELEVTPAALHDDWNYSRDIYGRIKPIEILDENTESPIYIYSPDIEIIWDESKWEDKGSFEYKKKYATWGTYGRDGKGPRQTKMLTELELDHLVAILDTQLHISQETRAIIKSILKDRAPKL
jgi:hypothetical protein